MAFEEISKPTSLPPYPEMILGAIDELNEEGGSNKSAISSHIESIYGELLPENHSELLSEHLNKMKDSGDLVFSKNCYMRFNPEAPPKRGRGRPRKDPNSPSPALKKTKTATSGEGSGRPRGRPPKKTTDDEGGESEEKVKSGRPRGRPPKSKPQQAPVGGVQDG